MAHPVFIAEELKSCPFCGGHADMSELEENGQIFFAVVCEDCGMSTMGSNEEDEVKSLWMKRV